MPDKDKKNLDSEAIEFERVQPGLLPSENFQVTEHLQRMPSIFSRGLLYVTVLALLSAFAYAVLAKIDMVVVARAIARPTTHMVRVLSDRNGYLERIMVSEGQFVDCNAPLFFIRSKESLTYRSKVEELRQSIPLKREYYDTKISCARDELRQLDCDFDNFMKVKNLKLEQNGLSVKANGSDLRFWETEVELFSKDFESIERLYNERAVSAREYNYTKSGLEKARSEADKLVQNREILSRESRIIREEMDKEKERYQNRRLILEKEIKNLALEKSTVLTALEKEQEMNEKKLSLQNGAYSGKEDEEEKLIRAENAGLIAELHFRNTGEYVRESDLLCTILPTDRPLYMDITVANKDIGFIEKNMEIKYKFDAFPHTDYGTLPGKALAISPSAIEDTSLGMVYHVEGSIDKTWFKIKGKEYPIKAGMTATAELVTEKRSVFSILFRKITEK
jgi:hemolysin D